MLRFTRLVPTFTLALLASLIRVPAAASQGEAPGPPTDTLAVTVFEDVNLVPMDRERVLEGQSVVIRGDRIAEIGARTGVRVPAGARRIDARELHMPVSGHVPSSIDVRHAIASGQSIEHLDGYLEDIGGDRRRIPELVRMTVEAGIWNTPTMDVWKTILGLRDPDSLRRERPEVQYLPHRTVDGWVGRVRDLRRKNPVRGALERGLRTSAGEIAALRDTLLRALYDGGARLMVGSDSPQVFSVPGFPSPGRWRRWSRPGCLRGPCWKPRPGIPRNTLAAPMSSAPSRSESEPI
jgi:hypothetical protein